jgi:hypothetical protein
MMSIEPPDMVVCVSTLSISSMLRVGIAPELHPICTWHDKGMATYNPIKLISKLE